MANIVDTIGFAKTYLRNCNEKRLLMAYEFACEAHGSQKRKSGDPYILHPLETAQILMSMRADEDTIVAALLHDVPEDTSYTLNDIKKNFGKDVAYIVDGITKLSKVHYRSSMRARQIESLKKLFLHSASDFRTILIKLADRLHNMRTLNYIRPEKQIRIARETMEIFVPISNLLGLFQLKSELEDLSFKYLYPEAYRALSLKIASIQEKQKDLLNEMIHRTQKALQSNTIPAEVFGRQKTLYSTYCKIERSQKTLIEIDDLAAIRIIVETLSESYQVLGIIHSEFPPKAGRFKDYIALPKSNGYQSLHTTVFGIDGIPIEFQIRTKKMHLDAEYGIAAHYFYDEQKKLGQAPRNSAHAHGSEWIHRILELQKDHKDHEDFLQHLKIDIFQDRIFVFTPKGNVVDLPIRGTCLDFAYAVHTDIGHNAIQAEVNGILCPLKTLLKTGDTVRIITSPEHRGPQPEWLHSVVTGLAKNRIRAYFRRQTRLHKIALGKVLLEKEFEHAGKNFEYECAGGKFDTLLKKFYCASLDELLMKIGDGTYNCRDVFTQFYEGIDVREQISGKIFTGNGFSDIPHYSVTIRVLALDRLGLLKNISEAISTSQANIISSKTQTNFKKNVASNHLTISVQNYDQLSQIFEKIKEIPNVYEVKRVISRRRISLIFAVFLNLIFWAVHPLIVGLIHLRLSFIGNFASHILTLATFAVFFLVPLDIHNSIKRYYPEYQKNPCLWIFSYITATFVFATTVMEIYFFHLGISWIFSLLFFALSLSAITFSLSRYRKWSGKC